MRSPFSGRARTPVSFCDVVRIMVTTSNLLGAGGEQEHHWTLYMRMSVTATDYRNED